MTTSAAPGPVDRLILDETADLAADRIAVLDDPDGSLTAAVADRSPDAVVVAHCDSLRDERAVVAHCAEVRSPATIAADRAEALTGADLVVLRLPRSTDALAETAELAARLGSGTVVLAGGGRTKHLSRGLNDALAGGFGSVRASLGRDKSRVLHARDPRTDVPERWPRRRLDAELGLEVHAHGGVFAGTRLDRGTRLLLSALTDWEPPGGPVLDLGCGTGILAAMVTRRWPDLVVTASDVSAAAVASAALTTGGAVRCQRADGLSGWSPESLGAIVTNPPFHVGAAKDSTPTMQMISDAGRVLRPGGELIMVYNAHLPYLPRLRRIGATTILARDRHYLVTRTVRG